MLDISAVLEEIKASPYEEMTVRAPHTGVVTFPEELTPGMAVFGPTGTWKERSGTLLATLDRERNPQKIRAGTLSGTAHFFQSMSVSVCFRHHHQPHTRRQKGTRGLDVGF